MKNILFVCSYAAAYRGNFIPSLECLENTYKEIIEDYVRRPLVELTKAEKTELIFTLDSI